MTRPRQGPGLGPIRLGVNVDHVATLRNARGGVHPDPVQAARFAIDAGADGITMHLREDRRHIVDDDIYRARAINAPLNFEMAATNEMQAIALDVRPHAVCLVPERREERTTEGGLNAAGDVGRLNHFIEPLAKRGIRVSLFLEPDKDQIAAAVQIGAPVIEFHTGAYAHAAEAGDATRCGAELVRLQTAAASAASVGIEVHFGHGLTYDNVAPIAAIRQTRELNIGHFLMGEAMFLGLNGAVSKMRELIDAARREATQ